MLTIGNTDSLNKIDNFLTYASLASADLDDSYKNSAAQASAALTDEDKALIPGYDEIVEDLFAVTISTEEALIKALNEAEDGAIIVLDSDITLTSGLPGTAISGKTLTINGKGHQISFAKGGGNLNGVFGNDVSPLYADTDLTVKDLTIVNTNEEQGCLLYTSRCV